MVEATSGAVVYGVSGPVPLYSTPGIAVYPSGTIITAQPLRTTNPIGMIAFTPGGLSEIIREATKRQRELMDFELEEQEKRFEVERIEFRETIQDLSGVVDSERKAANNAKKLAYYYETGRTEFDDGEDGWGNRDIVRDD